MSATRPTRDFAIGPFAASATRWLDEPDTRPAPAEPTRAATVMLVRGAPLEVFMIERAATMDFAPSTWVFPGGRVDAADADTAAHAEIALHDGGAAGWGARLGLPASDAMGVLVCAIRELFEEAGVLLADRGAAGEAAWVDTGTVAWRNVRERLEAHDAPFADAVDGLRLRGDLVEAVDRWVTPAFENRRFDTWFLTALLPDGAAAEAVSRESQQGRWVRPAAMLDECARGEVRLLPPTRTALERLTRAASADQALTQARAATFEPTHPRVLRGPEGLFLQAEVNL